MENVKRISRAEALELFTDLLRSGHSLRVRATGKSMSPVIKSGSYVTIRPDAGLPKTGSVVLTRPGRAVHVLHRCLKASDAGILTMGDATCAPDATVGSDAFLGRAVRVERGAFTLDLESFGWRMVGRLIASYKLLRLSVREAINRAACIINPVA